MSFHPRLNWVLACIYDLVAMGSIGDRYSVVEMSVRNNRLLASPISDLNVKSYTGIDFRSRHNCRVIIDDKKSLYVILIPNDLTYGDSF